MTEHIPSLTDLTTAASDVLIDMEAGAWQAIETDRREAGTVVVTLRRDPDPVQCICEDPDGDINPRCAACLDGQPEADYCEVELTIKEPTRG